MIKLFTPQMSKKRLSVRRQIELALLPDPDLPDLKTREEFASSELTNGAKKARTNISESVNEPDNHLFIYDEPNEANSVCFVDSGNAPPETTESSDYSEADFVIKPIKISLREQLRLIALQENMNLATLSKLLHALHPYHPELPLDARTLLQTP